MSSLFSISNDLEEIFYLLEENGGELTPELEERLALTQDNFKEKVGNYIKAIQALDSDTNECKQEVDRIKKLSDSKKKNKEKLSKALIDAIINYGDTNNKGIKLVDLGTVKAQIRESKAIELDEVLIQEIINVFFCYCQNLYDNNMLGVEELKVEEVVKIINENIIENPETSYLLYLGTKDVIKEDGTTVNEAYYRQITVDDFNAIKVNLSTTTQLSELCKSSYKDLIQAHLDMDWLSSHKDCTDKTSVKNKIELGELITIGKQVINNNLNIK